MRDSFKVPESALFKYKRKENEDSREEGEEGRSNNAWRCKYHVRGLGATTIGELDSRPVESEHAGRLSKETEEQCQESRSEIHDGNVGSTRSLALPAHCV